MFGPRTRASSLPSAGTSLSSTPGSRQADIAALSHVPRPAHSAKGAVSVAPRPVSMRMRSPQVAVAMLVERVPHVLRHAGSGIHQHLEAAEKKLRRSASSRRRNGMQRLESRAAR